MATQAPLLLIYPTSPVHVRDMEEVFARLPGWTLTAIVSRSLARVSPGIEKALTERGIPMLSFEGGVRSDAIPWQTGVMLLGAVFEPFALELLAAARHLCVPVAAIEEVAQLGLNAGDLNNYDAPFDRLFVASPDENEGFLALGHRAATLRISGLPAYERIVRADAVPKEAAATLKALGSDPAPRPIVYTTSPIRSRLAIHNKDSTAFRQTILDQLAIAGRNSGRRVVVKLHPNEEPAREEAEIRRAIPDAIIIGREMAIDDLLAVTGVLVNRGNSQTALEAVLRGVPTVVAACGLRTLFHDYGGAWLVDAPGDLPGAVAQALEQGIAPAPGFHERHLVLPKLGVAAFIASELELLEKLRPKPDDDAWNWLVRSRLFVGGHERALQLIREIGQCDRWREAVAAALTAHLAGDRTGAIAAWRACMALDSGWFFPHYELAHNCLAEDSYESAMAHARQAIALHPPFHGLWHEIPMRVVIMAALRGLGRDAEAATELAELERRELVAIVPELLIEKSAQATRQPQDLPIALEAVESALDQLERYPIDQGLDGELQARATAQLRQLADLADGVPDYSVAAACHARFVKMFPDDTWRHFALARATLGEGKWAQGLRMLTAMTAIPDTPRLVATRVLPAQMVAELLPVWPGTPGIHPRPWRLLRRTAAWCLHCLHASGGRDWPHALAFTILIGLFVPRHFLHQLLGREPVIP